jgi:hypothetical protein
LVARPTKSDHPWLLFWPPRVSRNWGFNFVSLSGPSRVGFGDGLGARSVKSDHPGMLARLPQVSRNPGLSFVGLSGPCRPGFGHGLGTQSAKSDHTGRLFRLPRVSRNPGLSFVGLSGPCRSGFGHGLGTQSTQSDHPGSLFWLSLWFLACASPPPFAKKCEAHPPSTPNGSPLVSCVAPSLFLQEIMKDPLYLCSYIRHAFVISIRLAFMYESDLLHS